MHKPATLRLKQFGQSELQVKKIIDFFTELDHSNKQFFAAIFLLLVYDGYLESVKPINLKIFFKNIILVQCQETPINSS